MGSGFTPVTPSAYPPRGHGHDPAVSGSGGALDNLVVTAGKLAASLDLSAKTITYRSILDGDISASAAIAYSKLSIASGDITWVKVSKTGSSIADLATKTHSLLATLTADDHVRYVDSKAIETGTGQARRAVLLNQLGDDFLFKDTGEWTEALAGGDSSTILPPLGIYRLTVTGTGMSYFQSRQRMKRNAGHTIRILMRLALSATSNLYFYIGAIEGTQVYATIGSEAATPALWLTSYDGSAYSSQAFSPAWTFDTAYHIYEIIITNTSVTAKLDGTQYAQVTANLPPTTQALRVGIWARLYAAGSAINHDFDWVIYEVY